MHIRQIFFGIDFFPLNRRSIPLVIPQVVEGPGTRRHLEVYGTPPFAPRSRPNKGASGYTPIFNFDQKRPIWDRGGGGWSCFQKFPRWGGLHCVDPNGHCPKMRGLRSPGRFKIRVFPETQVAFGCSGAARTRTQYWSPHMATSENTPN